MQQTNLIQLKPHLYELRLNSFIQRFGECPLGYPEVSFGFGCSSVRKGNFHGRNFDFTYDANPTYIVHVDRTPFNYAFAGMAKGILQDHELDLNSLPNSMLDGINENHVVVNINVVSKADLDRRSLGNFLGSHPGKEPIHTLCVPSMLLSRARSAVHAVQIMRDVNIFGNLVEAEYLHYMISDPYDTFVVEQIGDRLEVIGFPSNAHVIPGQMTLDFPIMTNWYLYTSKFAKPGLIDGKYTENGCGIERYDKIRDTYGSIENTRIGMFETMKSIRFTNEILLNPTDTYFPFSDFGFGAKYTTADYINDPNFKRKIDAERIKISKALDERDRTKGIWLTSHNTVYDIENNSFSLVFEEDYDTVSSVFLS